MFSSFVCEIKTRIWKGCQLNGSKQFSVIIRDENLILYVNVVSKCLTFSTFSKDLLDCQILDSHGGHCEDIYLVGFHCVIWQLFSDFSEEGLHLQVECKLGKPQRARNQPKQRGSALRLQPGIKLFVMPGPDTTSYTVTLATSQLTCTYV
jgi:hypothetical protein